MYCLLFLLCFLERIGLLGLHHPSPPDPFFFYYLSMLIFKEQTSRHKELTQTLIPLVQVYAKSVASPKAIIDFVTRFATVLESWDFSPKEIKDLDKRAFTDLLLSWKNEASANDLALIKAVF